MRGELEKNNNRSRLSSRSIAENSCWEHLDPKSGHEFSIVDGLTCRFTNGALQYQNGMDCLVDWAANS